MELCLQVKLSYRVTAEGAGRLDRGLRMEGAGAQLQPY